MVKQKKQKKDKIKKNIFDEEEVCSQVEQIDEVKDERERRDKGGGKDCMNRS